MKLCIQSLYGNDVEFKLETVLFLNGGSHEIVYTVPLWQWCTEFKLETVPSLNGGSHEIVYTVPLSQWCIKCIVV